jgi:threonyl-tRNA synthetase
LFNKSLWECSGHWENYKEDMFLINQIEHSSNGDVVENLEMGLKPMNCPGHCLIYGIESRSYRDLPLRYADFSPLHRY